MKIKRIASFIALFAVSLTAVTLLGGSHASAVADLCIWDGSSDSNIGTAANWSCSTDGGSSTRSR